MVRTVAEIVLLASPFFLTGLINRIKAIWAGRKGAPVLQPYYDFIRLLGKGEVISRTTTLLFGITPSLVLAAVILSALILPLPLFGAAIHFDGDFVLFAYLLGLAKFMAILAALDTGSSFEGMGASREATYSTIVETAFFVVIGSIGLLTGRSSFEMIFGAVSLAGAYTPLIKILLATSLFIMLLAEGSRVPVDDPNTHLELTMIHEVMILDYSGPDLAFIQYAAALKMTIISALMGDLIVPAAAPPVYTLAIFAGTVIAAFVAVGIVESLIARTRISHVPQFLFLMTTLSFTAFGVIAFFLFGGAK